MIILLESREPAEPELCHFIKYQFLRKQCELIRESDSELTKSLREESCSSNELLCPLL